ncbi:MAG: rRNA maturation RNase YbeY [Bacteroidetes bacterium]|nr:rRNA maturation RNase YbeY [Bacteroidota bacterium]
MSVSQIRFFFEDIPDTLRARRKLRQWLFQVISLEGKETGAINVVFCSDAVLLQMNKAYLNHDTLTDVITFDLAEPDQPGHPVQGEIYISLERVKENAAKFKVSVAAETQRVMVHGVLHLLGFNDGKPSQRLIMKEKEDFYLSLLANNRD